MKYEFFDGNYNLITIINFSKNDFEKSLRRIYVASDQIENNKYFNFKNLSKLKRFEKAIILLLLDEKKDIDKEVKKKLIKELRKNNSNITIYKNPIN